MDRQSSRSANALSELVESQRRFSRTSSNFTSSVTSIRTKNTFIEVTDISNMDLREYILSGSANRSTSLPPPRPLSPVCDNSHLLAPSLVVNKCTNQTITYNNDPVPNRKHRGNENSQPALPLPNVIQTGRIFVGGLAISTNDHMLAQHFAKYGELVEASVVVDRKRGKLSRGFGFIAFKNGLIPSNVLTDLHEIDSKTVGVRLYGAASSNKQITA